MKKTLIALFALAGAAVADSVPYTVQLDNMLESQTGWTTINGSANWGTSGQVKVNGWNSGVFQQTFEQGYTLHKGDSIEFSYELTIKHNAALTLTLISDDKALVTGWGGFQDQHQVAVGVTSTTAPGFYNFKDGTDQNPKNVKTDIGAVIETSSAAKDYTGTVTGVIEWSDTENAFVCTLSTNETNAQTITLSQSPSYTLNSVVVCANGNAGSNPVSNMSNLNMTLNLPEPATATLSLLALAALAARRKRH